MKSPYHFPWLAGCGFLFSFPVAVLATPTESRFTSRVYFMIHESTPYLVQRARRILRKEFADTVASIPQLQGRRYQVVSDGNEVIFTMVTDVDTRPYFENGIPEMVGQINGQVQTRGRYDLLRTRLPAPSDHSLEVVLDDATNTRIQSIVARAVTLRDLLAELKLQFDPDRRAAKTKRPRFSYMVPGECAARQIDWNFGIDSHNPRAKSLSEVMGDLARLLRLKVQNHQNTYIFSGSCPRVAGEPRQAVALELLPTGWLPLEEVTPLPPDPEGVVMPHSLTPSERAPVVPVHLAE